jgi:hypothetical protein
MEGHRLGGDMALFEVTGHRLTRHEEATFAALEMYERSDLQQLLKEGISALGEDLLVISEEFGNWEDARRRIDLLALDKDGRLVVIEIKRTDDGGHMELQAIRYAAMVSSMSFEDVLTAYTAYRSTHLHQEDVDPRSELEAFLELGDSGDEPVISSDVRIILVSGNFGREITTAVLWLNGFEGIDIRCVRLVPYEIDGRVFLDIQQVIPLPEAADYQVQIRRKGAASERASRAGRDLTRFHIIVDGEELPHEAKRNAARLMLQHLVARGVVPTEFVQVLPRSKLRVLEGQYTDGESVGRAMREVDSRVDLRRWFVDSPFVDVATNKTIVLSNQWGLQTEAKLTALSEAFPEAKVTLRRADPDS